MKYREFTKHSEPRKEVKDIFYAERSEAGNVFWKIILNCILVLPNLGVKGEFLVATKFFQVSCHFSMIFIKFFKIPWYFQVFQVSSHFSRFSRSSGNPAFRTIDASSRRLHLVSTFKIIFCRVFRMYSNKYMWMCTHFKLLLIVLTLNPSRSQYHRAACENQLFTWVHSVLSPNYRSAVQTPNSNANGN